MKRGPSAFLGGGAKIVALVVMAQALPQAAHRLHTAKGAIAASTRCEVFCVGTLMVVILAGRIEFVLYARRPIRMIVWNMTIPG